MNPHILYVPLSSFPPEARFGLELLAARVRRELRRLLKSDRWRRLVNRQKLAKARNVDQGAFVHGAPDHLLVDGRRLNKFERQLRRKRDGIRKLGPCVGHRVSDVPRVLTFAFQPGGDRPVTRPAAIAAAFPLSHGIHVSLGAAPAGSAYPTAGGWLEVWQ